MYLSLSSLENRAEEIDQHQHGYEEAYEKERIIAGQKVIKSLRLAKHEHMDKSQRGICDRITSGRDCLIGTVDRIKADRNQKCCRYKSGKSGSQYVFETDNGCLFERSLINEHPDTKIQKAGDSGHVRNVVIRYKQDQ